MDNQRDVQNSKRNSNSTLVMSGSSAVAMEIKRKKIRRSALFQEAENADIQAKLDFEVRMREGAYKLLRACSKREPMLSASKNLLTCNARIEAYMGHMQETKEKRNLTGELSSDSDARVPCRGTLALSGLRIPLMWKDQDHFNNRGSSRRVAVFCVMRMGCQVVDTKMAVVDRSVTDVCFEEVAVFEDALPGFTLRVELWSCAAEDELTPANTPRKLAKKLRNSLGKKWRPLPDTPDPDAFLQSNPLPAGAEYHLLAYSTLTLPAAECSFQSHSLVVLQNSDWSSWLPLYGNLCCRLAAQPACMTQRAMAGYLDLKPSAEAPVPRRLFCVLSAATLSCHFGPEEPDAEARPALRLPVNKDTRIRVMEKQSGGEKFRSLSIINPSPEGTRSQVFTADTPEQLDRWQEALHQHLYDQSRWLHCCERPVTIEAASPRKPSLFLAKPADSVYNDLSINSPGKCESVTDIIRSKIQESNGRFLIGDREAGEPPNWAALFDGSPSFEWRRKTGAVLSRSQTRSPLSSPKLRSGATPDSGKKRRAPLPPTGPAVPPPAHIPRPERPPRPRPCPPPPPLSHPQKENTLRAKSKTGRRSLDAKFSAIVQQLQHNAKYGGGLPAAGRKNAPLGVDGVAVPRSRLRESSRERSRLKAGLES
ncbi:LOW QUALITY PROTEIN: rhotekin-2 [Hippocampus comes]|uniref:LOW QUALITY PROTEIN: rhotekin-2 n=1 Tax=Hippocampus comes TaxID=109280 RepID=UPI00094E8CC4|nr:PREDICTED: LOW QUALITY PROTEIN: rhotekin-2-like [Hippocampus comes]